MNKNLFKGKRIDNEEWAEGSLLIDEQGNHYIGVFVDKTEHYVMYGRGGMKTAARFEGVVLIPVDPKTTRQFTGELDKTGIEIFEDDIIKVDFETEYVGLKPSPSYVGVVKYEKGAFGIYEKGKGTQFFFQHGLIKTVIGNTHDNPNLLESEEKI